LARNENNVPEWSDMSTRGLLFQWASTKNPTQRVGLEQCGPHNLIEISLFLPWYSWKITKYALNNNHSLIL
jgi:hypothetical protein